MDFRLIPLLSVLLLPALILGAGCVRKSAVDDDDTTEECVEEESLLTPYYVEGGQIWCGSEMPGDMTCFDCHLCAVSDEAAVSKQHYVCNFCHDGPSGEVTDTEHAETCGCVGLTCEDPTAPLGCVDCHKDGCNGYVSAQVMRDSCLYCHTWEVPEG
jgi:hypothetical protein